jgi:8-oxo-dGTP pyrophosphatase MutT (NUDIX family)
VPPEDAGRGSATIGPWQRTGGRVAYKNPWITVYHDDVVRPDGSPGIYGVVHFENLAVGVVAIDDQDRVVLVGQHRYPLDVMSWEIPEGGSPHGEDGLQGAMRELREETGVIATTWREIARCHLSNSISDEEAVLYLATDLETGAADPDDTEQLTVRWVPFDHAIAMIAAGEISDAMSVIALQRLALERRPSPAPQRRKSAAPG